MKKQILAIDDSKAIRFLLQTVLGKDYQVVTVPDGYSAMYYLSHRTQPDLIIADPQLPDMENWELIQQLSSSGMYGDIPVLALSGLDRTETEAKCVEYGVVRYFMKPFNPVELMNAIHQLVRSGELDKGLSALAS
ncbi:MAG TPA: response regulator [Puia sp.]|nr:response regulator [Puia sp.]